MADIDLKNVAKLARLHLTDDEIRHLEGQVKGILDFVEQLKEVNVEGIEPTTHPFPVRDVFREDEPKPSLKIEEFLKTAPKAKGRFFEVPKIIEDKS